VRGPSLLFCPFGRLPTGAARTSKVVGSQQMLKAGACCTLCPAGCGVQRVQAGPDVWRIDPPLRDTGGLCPRGVTLGELLNHRKRILWPARREDGGWRQATMDDVASAVAAAARERGVTVFLDANVPCEQLSAAASWCRAWPGAKLCLVLEPAEEQLLLGVEAGGAEHVGEDALADCDGFLIVGDAFAANPRASRGVFLRRTEQARTPIISIDPAGGTAAKFATHAVPVVPGQEAGALAALAAGAGVRIDLAGLAVPKNPAARAAGEALARCERPAVLLAAEHGRTAAWREVGYLASQLAAAMGGQIACETAGANALAALRYGAKQGTVGLAEALADRAAAWVVVGCDLLGMLGWTGVPILAAAAAMPNETTNAAGFVLPVALPAEMAGTFLLSGLREAAVEAVLPPPAGVPTPGELIEKLALAAGAGVPVEPDEPAPFERLACDPPAAVACADPDGLVLLFGRQAAQAGCGALTGHGAWQQAVAPLPELRLSEADAEAMGVAPLAAVGVSANGTSVRAVAHVSRQTPRGVAVLPEGSAACRRLAACEIDESAGQVLARPAVVEITP